MTGLTISLGACVVALASTAQVEVSPVKVIVESQLFLGPVELLIRCDESLKSLGLDWDRLSAEALKTGKKDENSPKSKRGMPDRTQLKAAVLVGERDTWPSEANYAPLFFMGIAEDKNPSDKVVDWQISLGVPQVTGRNEFVVALFEALPKRKGATLPSEPTTADESKPQPWDPHKELVKNVWSEVQSFVRDQKEVAHRYKVDAGEGIIAFTLTGQTEAGKAKDFVERIIKALHPKAKP